MIGGACHRGDMTSLLCTDSGAVIHPDSPIRWFWHCINSFRDYLLPYLFISLRIGPFRFQDRDHKRRPNLDSVFVFIMCYSIFCNGCILAFVMLDLVSVLSQKIGWEAVSKMTYFVSTGTYNLNSITKTHWVYSTECGKWKYGPGPEQSSNWPLTKVNYIAFVAQS